MLKLPRGRTNVIDKEAGEEERDGQEEEY